MRAVVSDHPPRPAAGFDVGVLFYNRARQTLDCILSFLDDEIEPSIIVLDQGSAADQRALLEDALSDRPNVRFVTLPHNIGVGPGRNRLSRECSSDWILFLDNDTALGTDGGIRQIDLAIAGAADVDGFSPRILNVHENRIIDRLRIAERNGSLKFEALAADATVTNTFSGCAFLVRRAFMLGEAFDERHFVGFEDFELALRAFTHRRPMRIRVLDDVTFAHKHMPVINDPDVTSTRMRYSSPELARSFDAIRAQYDRQLFQGWERWTSKQQKEMIARRPLSPRPVGETPRLAFVADARASTSGAVIENIAPDLLGTFALTTIHTHELDEPAQALQLILEFRPDIIHFMWRLDFGDLVNPATIARCAELMNMAEPELTDLLCQSRITLSVSDYLFLDREEIGLFRPLYWLCDGYCVTSAPLYEIYRKLADYPNPAAVVSVDVDGNLPAGPADPGGALAWADFLNGVARDARPDAPNWRRFMIDKFFLSRDEPDA